MPDGNQILIRQQLKVSSEGVVLDEWALSYFGDRLSQLFNGILALHTVMLRTSQSPESFLMALL